MFVRILHPVAKGKHGRGCSNTLHECSKVFTYYDPEKTTLILELTGLRASGSQCDGRHETTRLELEPSDHPRQVVAYVMNDEGRTIDTIYLNYSRS